MIIFNFFVYCFNHSFGKCLRLGVLTVWCHVCFTMDGQNSLLAYVDITEGCNEAVKLLDLKVPSFAKTLRRIMKKLEKGETSVEKPLMMTSFDGSEVVSDFKLTASKESEKLDMLFAKFPTADGESDIYQLPFVRLSVRRCDQLVF